jgi:hypothetical protein
MLTPPEPFAHDGHLSPDDPCLGSRHQPLALVKRKPERLLRREIIALNAGQLSLGRNPRLELGDQLHPPHQLRHGPSPSRRHTIPDDRDSHDFACSRR